MKGAGKAGNSGGTPTGYNTVDTSAIDELGRVQGGNRNAAPSQKKNPWSGWKERFQKGAESYQQNPEGQYAPITAAPVYHLPQQQQVQMPQQQGLFRNYNPAQMYPYGGAFAGGGRFGARKRIIVGENGPEEIVLDQPGEVIANVPPAAPMSPPPGTETPHSQGMFRGRPADRETWRNEIAAPQPGNFQAATTTAEQPVSIPAGGEPNYVGYTGDNNASSAGYNVVPEGSPPEGSPAGPPAGMFRRPGTILPNQAMLGEGDESEVAPELSPLENTKNKIEAYDKGMPPPNFKSEGNPVKRFFKGMFRGWKNWDGSGGLLGGIAASLSDGIGDAVDKKNELGHAIKSEKNKLFRNMNYQMAMQKNDLETTYQQSRIKAMETEAERDKAYAANVAEQSRMRAALAAAAPYVAKQKAHEKRVGDWEKAVTRLGTERNKTIRTITDLTSTLTGLKADKAALEAEMKRAVRPADRNRVKSRIDSINVRMTQIKGDLDGATAYQKTLVDPKKPSMDDKEEDTVDDPVLMKAIRDNAPQGSTEEQIQAKYKEVSAKLR